MGKLKIDRAPDLFSVSPTLIPVAPLHRPNFLREKDAQACESCSFGSAAAPGGGYPLGWPTWSETSLRAHIFRRSPVVGNLGGVLLRSCPRHLDGLAGGATAVGKFFGRLRPYLRTPFCWAFSSLFARPVQYSRPNVVRTDSRAQTSRAQTSRTNVRARNCASPQECQFLGCHWGIEKAPVGTYTNSASGPNVIH